MLALSLHPGLTEAGVDEAGRGPLAGPVFAAAVVLPPDFEDERLDDSKKMSEGNRTALRTVIENSALGWAVAEASAGEIDRLNILNATYLAMTRAVLALRGFPAEGIIASHSLPADSPVDCLLIDGNRFKPQGPHLVLTPFECVVKGDGRLAPIAAASVLAKTYRDDRMAALHAEFPLYDWLQNKGYPTPAHRTAVLAHGPSPHHRTTFLRRLR